MATHQVSIRVSHPQNPAFAALTDAWLDELRADYQRCMGAPFRGERGVLLASEVLVALHGDEADWALWDVDDFEVYVREVMPGSAPMLPALLSEVLCFVNLHGRRDRVPVPAVLATQARVFELLGMAAEPPIRSPKRGRRLARRATRRAT